MMSGAMYTPRKNVVNYGQVFILHRVTRKMAGTYLCRVTRPRLNKNLGFIWVTERQRGSAIDSSFEFTVMNYSNCLTSGRE